MNMHASRSTEKTDREDIDDRYRSRYIYTLRTRLVIQLRTRQVAAYV